MSTHKLQLLVTSDIHGYIMPTAYRGMNEPLGLAQLATKIEVLRSNYPTILIDNGDLIQGSPLTYFKQAYRPLESNPIIKATNELKYDAAIFGNHEFNYGRENLERIIEQSDYPWLSCNIRNDDGNAWVKPYEIFIVDGVRIGVIGVTTHFITIWEDPAHLTGLQIDDALASVSYWLEVMKEQEKVHVSVISYHGGFSHSLETGELEESDSGENQGYQMLQQLDFDILITGHQHREISSKAYGKSIVQPGSRAVKVGQIMIDITLENDEVIFIHHEPTLISLDEHDQLHPKVVASVSTLHEETEQWLDEPIATVHGNMLYENAMDVRIHKHPYVQFLQELQMDVTGTTISCTSLFHDQPGGFKPIVTMRDIVTNYIYPNTLKVLAVTGEQLMLALEQCASYFTLENDQIAVNPSFLYPKAQPYNYDMWEGIYYTMDISKPIGSRIVQATINELPIKPMKTFHVVMNNYRATGAGNFPYFASCPVISDLQIDMTEVIATYLREHPVIHAHVEQNWDIIK
ncbi:bifunctional metallophosphatase/5'-nucleotidase [Paenibacillus endoradicis]|uniref:bifunctional metallophosphatase/5'-nucleotidase n=1 Tax=Paenibacillus endoradicis TaxID=2972487 RepID=UPI002158A97C|nr:bifunctional metallophosphatase/5'-nucleotidase [Paenibacillus endoradicis]MCR8659153.1 bifunctional metallophosphatase/5'-nucleotidase [Paenibacillus endoradicis]